MPFVALELFCVFFDFAHLEFLTYPSGNLYRMDKSTVHLLAGTAGHSRGLCDRLV